MSYTQQEMADYLIAEYHLDDEPRVTRVVELFFSDNVTEQGQRAGQGDLEGHAEYVYNTPAYWDKAADEKGDYDGGPPTWEDILGPDETQQEDAPEEP